MSGLTPVITTLSPIRESALATPLVGPDLFPDLSLPPLKDNVPANPQVIPLSPDSLSSTPEKVRKVIETGEKLGKGGYARVMKGKDEETGSPVACKKSKASNYEDAVHETFVFQLHQKQGTRHCMPLRAAYDSTPQKKYGESHPIRRIVTDFVPGGDLYHTHLKKDAPRGPIKPAQIKTVIKQALEFLIDSREIMHGDLKPRNLYLKKDGQVYVSDFGLSYSPDLEYEPQDCATVPYRPPEEILRPLFNVDAPFREPAVDVWCLGCVFFELLTGNLLFNVTSKTPDEVHLQMIAEQIGLPNRKFLEPHSDAKDFYDISDQVELPIKLKVLPPLPPSKKWQEASREAARSKGISDIEIDQIVDLLSKMLCYERPAAKTLLDHPYFSDDISFDLIGNFSPSDIICFYPESPEGQPAIEPTIEIEKPTKIRHCLHIPKGKYTVRVVRDQESIFSKSIHFEKDGEVSLELPPTKESDRLPRAKRKLDFEAEDPAPAPFSPSIFFKV